ncbi:Zinc finger protein [Nakaseomyces glabratus]|nr:Zinc finger protein [Nakaseomyces glabratus]KTB24901.1 Zinc finger protein [Nakaseomyces glabratus]
MVENHSYNVTPESVSLPSSGGEVHVVRKRSKTVSMVVGEDGQYRYKCPHPTCDKSFSRQEHLSRHKLNHWPKEIFKCHYVSPLSGQPCGKTFVRRDLLNRHEKRHENKSYTGRKSRSISREITPGITSPVAESPSNPSFQHSETSAYATSSRSNSNSSFTVGKFSVTPQEESGNKRKRQRTKSSQKLNETTDSIGPIDPKLLDPSEADRSIYTTPAEKEEDKPKTIPVYNNDILTNANNNIEDPNDDTIMTFISKKNARKQQKLVKIAPKPHNSRARPANNVIDPAIHQFSYPERKSVDHKFNNESIPAPYNAELLNYGNTIVQEKSQKKRSQSGPDGSNVSRDVFDWNSVMADRDDAHQSISNSNSSTNLNKVYDLFSIDFLSDDPLQNFMQELSVGHKQGGSMTSAQASTQSTNPVNSPTQDSNCSSNGLRKSEDIHLQAMPKFDDSQKSHIKDNLSTQKININNFIKKDKEQRILERDSDSKRHHHKKRKNMKLSMRQIPSFFFTDQATKFDISKDKCLELFNLVPELRYIPAIELKKSLKSFWYNFHPQYGLLHKPSFNVNDAPAILILSMIMTGASFLGSNAREMVSDPICGPLRWIIFSHPDFQPPSQTYIIQSLLLLEGYEKASTNRYLHERSFLHHGTTIQLLRRTPSLGGHPSIVKREGNTTAAKILDDEQGQRDALEEIYRQWIDFEMLKRIAFYAFYMDTTHAVVFGYWNLFIHCNQIQLNLPCSDEIWESYDLSYETLLNNGFGGEARVENYQFLPTLKSLMNEVTETLRIQKLKAPTSSTPEAVKAAIDSVDKVSGRKWNIRSIFGKKLLLAGIISIMFQCQEAVLPTTFRVGDGTDQVFSWTEIVSFAANYWLIKVQGDCTAAKSCMVSCGNDSDILTNSDVTVDEDVIKLDLLGEEADTICKIPVYHVIQIVLRIFHNDYYIYAGAPWRMNVRLDKDEYSVVSNRVRKFASDPYNGGVAIVHGFQFLFQMFLKVDSSENDGKERTITFKDYDINSDYIITRPNTVALISVLIWCYNNVLFGPESQIWDNSKEEDVEASEENTRKNNEAKELYTPKESFEQYLIRMYHSLYIDTNTDVITYQNEIWAKATILGTIPNTNNMCGMMLYMRDTYRRSFWDLGREFGNLFDNCLERSMGKSSPTCFNMYDV